MKKLLALALTLALLAALGAPALAAEVVASPQGLSVDGETVLCEKYNIDGSNYFKLRDLAALFDGTGSQFDVGWDDAAKQVSITTHHAYTAPDGHELEVRGDLSATAQRSAQTILIDGVERSDLSVFNIGGSNFFRLRELGAALGFAVDFDYGSNTAEIYSVTAPEHVRLVGMGERVYVDLDGDGVAETVRVWLEKDPEYGYWYEVHLSIDGEDFTGAMIEARDGNSFDAPDEFWWAITDLDSSDDMLEIAIQDWGPSDDLTTSFFRYDGQGLRFLGAPEGFLYFLRSPASLTLIDGGKLQGEMRLHVLQTWYAEVEYGLDAEGRLAVIPKPFYTSTYEDQQTVTQCDLYGYDAIDGNRSVLPAGTAAQIVGTDDAAWLLLRLADGSDCYLRFGAHGYELEAPDGVVWPTEALNNLNMAD